MNWQVFWLVPSLMPSHSANRTVALEYQKLYKELTAAVSAQDFHLIPFSLIPSRMEGMST